MKLNKEQYIAARHKNGPMLVLAGPGSGKTHLLVERITLMIEEYHIPPESIMVITFSKKAAVQMQKRFEKRVAKTSYSVTFGTFHAVFYHILQQFDPGISRLITEEECFLFVSGAIADCRPDSDFFRSEENTDIIAGLISSYKNFREEFFERNEFASKFKAQEAEEFERIFDHYCRLVRDAGLIDFDDMIIRCREVLRKHESVLRKWQNLYRYFLVDEFQDINEAQYDVLRLLAGDERNVFAVGDDDQSIYAFRGARPELMKKFLHQCPGCKQVILKMNYRCSANIIGAADTLVRHNLDRLDRPMQDHLPQKRGGTVEIIHAESAEVQAEYVCDRIMSLMEDNGYSRSDFAVLYRSGHCARIFRKKAGLRGLYDPVKSAGSINMMTAHASKGLEFPCVFIIGLQEGLFPHYRDMDGNCEEERRLMYVAMTRAKERLYMCALGSEHGKRSSRFINEVIEKKKYIRDYINGTRI